MVVAFRLVSAWSVQNSGASYIPTIGSRPRRLAGVPEEAPADAKMPPAMEVLRFAPVAAPAAAVAAEPTVSTAPPAEPPTEAPVEPAAAEDRDLAPSGVILTEIIQGDDEVAEHVVIVNSGPNPVVLEGWRITDEGEQNVYAFSNLVLISQATLRVHMSVGDDTETDLFVGDAFRWWNDAGDTIYLYDAAGALVHSLTYDPAPDPED
jgi:Lamin Tail Domain